MSPSRAPVFSCAHCFQARLRRLREILVKWYKLTFVVDRKPGYVHTNTDIFETAHIFTRIFTRQETEETEYNYAIISGGPRGGGGIWNPPPYQT